MKKIALLVLPLLVLVSFAAAQSLNHSDFGVSLNPTSVAVTPGGSGSSHVSIVSPTPAKGWGDFQLTCASATTLLACSTTAMSLQGGTVTVTPASGLQAGTYHIAISVTATNGSQTVVKDGVLVVTVVSDTP